MEDIFHQSFSKKSLCIGGMNLSLRGRDRSEVLESGKKDSQQVIKGDGARVGAKVKVSKNIQQRRPLSFSVENEIIRKFLEKNGLSSLGTGNGEKMASNDVTSDVRIDSGDQKLNCTSPELVNKRTTDVATRARKPILFKQSITPRLRSPKSGETIRRELQRRKTLADLINVDVKEATTVNIDPEAEISVEYKHYDRWARTKRTAVVSRTMNPDPKYLKMKLSNDAFCFSTSSLICDDSSYGRNTGAGSSANSLYGYESCRDNNGNLQNSDASVESANKTQDVAGCENNQKLSTCIHSVNKSAEKDSDETKPSVITNTPSFQDDNQIVNDTAQYRKWSLGSRRRSSMLLHHDILQSLRDSCSLVITLAQQGDKKLSLSRRVSRSDNVFDKKVDLDLSDSQDNSENDSVTSEMSTDRQGRQEIERENESDDEEKSDFENILQENCHSYQEKQNKDSATKNCAKEFADDQSRGVSFESDSISARGTPNTTRSQFGREKVQKFKIPLTISKRSPIFSQEDNISIDFQSKRIEEHLTRVQHRNDTAMTVLRRNNCMSNETEEKYNHISESKFKIALPKQQKASPKCETHSTDHLSRWKLRDSAKWKQRVQALCKGKSYRVSLKSNGIIVKNKYGEFIDHVNLRFLAPLLMKEHKSDFI